MKTVKVRIAVCVNSDGQWAASGWSTADKDQMEDVASDMLTEFPLGNDTIHYITAEVPLPSSLELRGVVEKKK